MTLKSLLITLFLSLLLFTNAIAQTATGESALVESTKAGPELEKKALALVEDIITQAQGFKNLENRLRINVRAANLIWTKDEKRARTLFRQAKGMLTELLGGMDVNDPEYMTQVRILSGLRQELVQTVAYRDATMAREFLRTTRSLIQDEGPYGEINSYVENQLEMSVATNAAASDPKQALEIANEMLKKDFPDELLGVMQQLREKDQEAAGKLASSIVTKLKTENLGTNYRALNMAVSLLTEATEEAGSETKPGAKDKTPATKEATPLLDEQALRELSEMIATATLNLPAEGAHFMQMVQPVLPQIEKYAPARAAQLRRKVEQWKKEAQKNPWYQYQELSANGTVESLLEAAPKAPEEIRPMMYQGAAMKAAEGGDMERARQIINEHIKNPVQRSQMLAGIETAVITKAAEQGKVDQARRMLGLLRTNEQRVEVLVQLALRAAQKGDKKIALELLNEARGMSSARAKNYTQLFAQLQVARAYAHLDPARSFAILEPVIDHLNELLAAAVVLGSFITEEFVKDDEIILESLNFVTNMLTNQYGVDLNALARADFDRTKAAADRFQREEVRILMRLAVAQSVLIEPVPVKNTDGTGRATDGTLILTTTVPTDEP